MCKWAWDSSYMQYCHWIYNLKNIQNIWSLQLQQYTITTKLIVQENKNENFREEMMVSQDL